MGESTLKVSENKRRAPSESQRSQEHLRLPYPLFLAQVAAGSLGISSTRPSLPHAGETGRKHESETGS